ncbi:MAG: ABC transporter permease [Microbacterium sp.]|jgi:ABC-type lipoprotein release transport system permease subunit|uniref:ABC transporter permease n=1 Tax=Microbacterium sp. TaxID=51671 RepID=UPI002838DDC1|nr:ABC transporter permease [Microbacterium sp.]MDR2320403.1 ABC transporter permease [Microbacterium sp.]
MYGTYLRRELAGRKKQTVIVAVGLAIAIALVIVVNALAAGVRDAQTQALARVYGVGTDLTVTGAPAQRGSDTGQRFAFGAGGGAAASDGSTTLKTSVLRASPARGTIDAAGVKTISGTGNVAAATGALSLTNLTFDGQIAQQGTQGGTGQSGTGQSGTGEGQGTGERPRFGGGNFGLNSFSVLGVDPSAGTTVGPLSSVKVSSGRALAADDAGQLVALADSTYATSKSLSVGSTIDVGGSTVKIVGIVTSSSDSADTAANVYLPLDTAQKIAGTGDVVSTVYVKAASASDIATVQAALAKALPTATVSSQADLASTVSGSLASAAGMIEGLGTWLSIIVLAVAVLLAVLFTLSGVARRTREFGTLKAIGWSNGRIVRQVAGESLVQGLIGGAAGLALGLVGILVVNLVQPTISGASASGFARGGGAGGAGGAGSAGAGGAGGAFQGGGGGGAFRGLGESAQAVVLHAPLSVTILIAAVGLAILGGLVAGAIGGWRAARLSPAEALRSAA